MAFRLANDELASFPSTTNGITNVQPTHRGDSPWDGGAVLPLERWGQSLDQWGQSFPWTGGDSPWDGGTVLTLGTKSVFQDYIYP